MNSKNIITVVIIVIAAALLVGVFIKFGGSKSNINSDLQVAPSAASSNSSLSRELLSALSSLKDLKLDSSFFKDTTFASLIDYSKDITDDQTGRDNPFLPVSGNVINTPEAVVSAF